MCGIAGFYSDIFNKEDLQTMVSKLRHRGPDADGIFFDQKIGLAHTRLSIQDLSPLANQPFYSASGRYIVIYNGEVYNFKELASQLDVSLKTKSDTEVIVELFEKFGLSFADKLFGMFAIAIWDKEKRELCLFRDRLGVKPLYYYWDNKNFIFSSEMKALLELDSIKKNISLNNSSISSFLHLGYIPSPLTIYKNIYKAPSGSYIIINENEFRIETFWSPEKKIQKINKIGYPEAKEELKHLLNSSINYRLISDVPIGILLSGGIDSSLITAIAQKNSSSPLNTFTISYEDKDVDESKYAKDVADYLGTIHSEYRLTAQDAKAHLESIMDSFDEPYADSSALPAFLVSKLAGEKVKVLLSGEGGDELFMGYGTYNWTRRFTYPGMHAMRNVFAGFIDKFGGTKYKGRSAMFKYPDTSGIHSHIFSQEQYYFSEEDIKRILNPEHYAEFSLGQNFGEFQRTLSLSEKQSFFDIKYYLKDDLLTKMDMTSMLNSVEARTPLLDHRIVEFALNLPENYKFKNGTDKYILRDVLNDYVPKKYYTRPKKGFSIPLNKWLKNDLSYLLDEYLSEKEIKRFGVINYEVVHKIKDDFYKGHNYLYVKLWTLIMLQKFLHNFSKVKNT
jgi:asparagine synthase (glutamine-hydrolysing)